MDRTLSGATAPDQSGLGRDGNEGVPHIPQSSSITGTSSLDSLVSYTGHSLGESGRVLTLCRDAIGVSSTPADGQGSQRENSNVNSSYIYTFKACTC